MGQRGAGSVAQQPRGEEPTSVQGLGGYVLQTLVGKLENEEKRTLKVPVSVPKDGLQQPWVWGWGAAHACPEAEQGGGLVLGGQLDPSGTGGSDADIG